MTTPKRRYIDELLRGIKRSNGGPVLISLETAKRLKVLWDTKPCLDLHYEDALRPLAEKMPMSRKKP